MTTPAKLLILAALVSLALAGCGEQKPAHYYVFCDGKDRNGWELIGTESDKGFLLACTYQSPDKKQVYTVRCRESGCD